MTAEVVPQHMEALKLANEYRIARATLRRTLKGDGPLLAPLRVAHVLCGADRPDWIEGMTIFDLAAACPRFGRQRVLPILALAGVSEITLVGSATVRQRQAVAAGLDWTVRDRLSRKQRMAFERQLRAERVG